MAGKLAEVEQLVEQFQDTTQALKYSMVPTVAAVDGLALGGGCEFIMHCDRAVATLESYIGLVEAGVGLLPAGGGCKEFAMRAAADAKGGEMSPFLQKYFKAVAMAEVGTQRRARARARLPAADRPRRDEPLRAAGDRQGGAARAGRARLPPAAEADGDSRCGPQRASRRSRRSW